MILSPWRRLLKRKVIVNTKTGRTFGGMMWAKNGALLTLKETQLFEAGRDPVPVDGEVILERSNIDFIQLLNPSTPGD